MRAPIARIDAESGKIWCPSLAFTRTVVMIAINDFCAVVRKQQQAGESKEGPIFVKDVLLNILVVVGILGLSAVITNVFARSMYIRCSGCGTLNARRRTACRSCQSILRDE